MEDVALEAARDCVLAAADENLRPQIHALFDEATASVTYVVADPRSRACAIIDSVADFDAAAGRVSHRGVADLEALIEREGLSVAWILETHVHADHLSAAAYLAERYGAPIGIGAGIGEVQALFGPIFGAPPPTSAPFDRLFEDGERLSIGQLECRILACPGHTPADVAYVVGDAVFIGDSLFMPDFGTARADFPGGDARRLYRSIRRLLSLPPKTRLFCGHDYKAPGRDQYAWETTVAAQNADNVHVGGERDEAAFVAMRNARDAALPVPKLLWPALQVNLNAGRLPAPGVDGRRRLILPLDAI
ncbi:MBL fold metallo-hydrolase [Caulobacter segnis]|uniref:MBL fold metallo-hydrolase n=1 Tax=Caulobacter segnis TaxID=88688 RepID=UPI00240FFEF4|nr:MBL fold metallo-hydrolase [Caulobacter segnis]MDG2522929.1 MBL fold metallo-hydrolase [Caulobacter segnis]